MPLLLLSGCTKVIHLPDPEEPQASTAPIVTVIYDPGALGDRTYNDLIYLGVEEAATRLGLRTVQLSPKDYEEGIAYLEAMKMAVKEDTVRRLYIVAATSFDEHLRKIAPVFNDAPRADLLYLETTKTLAGSKGSTLFMPYYGAMYEAGALIPTLYPNAVVVASNPVDQTVAEAVAGITEGFSQKYFDTSASWWETFSIERSLQTIYLADEPGQGYSLPDSTAIHILRDVIDELPGPILIPLCGGAGHRMAYYAESLVYIPFMGIDHKNDSKDSFLSAVKHIDRAVGTCIEQWLSPEGMPKHQVLGLASGLTEVIVHPRYTSEVELIEQMVTPEIREQIHRDAIKKEEAYER
ncbi:MAG: hypothetical protein J6X53_03255 [Abditibacteriota bacterium]|nr:hypothetical protein [Abditibacteriota bacterium]